MSDWRAVAGPVGIALLCAGLLSATYQLTGARIADNQAARELALLNDLLPTTVSVSAQALNWTDDQLVLCEALLVVSRFSASGYAGPINGLLAWQPTQRRATGIRVLEHLETPGIADFLNETGAGGWLGELLRRDPEQLTQVDAVSGATISSNAVTETVAMILSSTNPLPARCPQ